MGKPSKRQSHINNLKRGIEFLDKVFKGKKWGHSTMPGRGTKAEHLADIKATENRDRRRHKPKGQR